MTGNRKEPAAPRAPQSTPQKPLPADFRFGMSVIRKSQEPASKGSR